MAFLTRGYSGRQGRCAWLFRPARTVRVVIPDGKDDARGYSGLSPLSATGRMRLMPRIFVTTFVAPQVVDAPDAAHFRDDFRDASKSSMHLQSLWFQVVGSQWHSAGWI